MGIKRTFVDAGAESPREDYPWRPIKVLDPYSADDNLIHISPRSCLMGGLDVMGKYPVAGLGIDFRVSELDFVWLAVYFDTNLRPIHAGVCKGPKWTRWYEYGGVSMGGFPRTIKTVRRDHIGVEVGAPDSAAGDYVLPDVTGPEMDYLDFEMEKEVESLSRQGYLHKVERMQEFKRAMAQELTYFVKDTVQVKQWAAFTLLGYSTSKKPDNTYPFPFVELKKVVEWNPDDTPKNYMTYYFRQSCTTHLMLQEVNAMGVRACHLTPSFPPYMETLPHPIIELQGAKIIVQPSNGLVGTLPAQVVNDPKYNGTEMAYGTHKSVILASHPEKAGNFQIVLPEPGENSYMSNTAVGVIGAADARVVYYKTGGSAKYQNARYAAPGRVFGGNPGHEIDLSDLASITLYMMKERCLDSKPITITNDNGTFFYSSDDTDGPIQMN